MLTATGLLDRIDFNLVPWGNAYYNISACGGPTYDKAHMYCWAKECGVASPPSDCYEGAPLCHQVSSVLAAHMRAKQSKANAYSQTDTDTVVTGAGQTVGLQTRPAVPSEAPALGLPAFSSVCSSDLRRARQGHSKGISSLTNSKCATGPEHDHKNNLKVRQTSIWSSRRRRLSTTVPQATAQALADQSITLHLRVANPSTSDVSSPAEDMGGPTVVAAKPMFAFQPRPNVAKSKAVRMAKAAAQSMFMGPIKLLLVSLVIAPARAEALDLHNRYARYPPCPYSPLPPPPPTPQKSANRVAELLRDCRPEPTSVTII